VATRIWTHALVTGASSGIGERIARRLAHTGSGLTLVARSEDRLDALADELREECHAVVDVLAADLTDEDDLARVEARLRDDERPIDLLVNNAGFGTSGRFTRLDVDREEDEIRLNVAAVVRLSHAAIPGMRDRAHGGVLNVASMAALSPLPFMATYGATKAFVLSFSESVHEELRGTGVHVTCLAPGFVRTAFQEVADVTEASGRIPDAVWLDADDVAAAGLAGVAANRAVVVPGLGYRALGVVARMSPSALRRKLVRRGMGA
jgi:uncharacterized protein